MFRLAISRIFSGAVVCLVLAVYWSYLFVSTRMEVAYDSIDYMNLGALIANNGIGAYLQNGPGREPLYPFLITAANFIAGIFSVTVLPVLTLLQLCIFGVALLMLRRLALRCGVPRPVTWGLILYMGLSPAMVNSALSVYSEIMTYPLVLLAVILVIKGVDEVLADVVTAWISGALAGAVLFLLAMVKGGVEVTAPVFLLGVFVLLLVFVRQARARLKHLLVMFCCVFVVFIAGVHGFKALNYAVNGHYSVTNSRVVFSLYGNIKRRVETMSAERFKAGVAFIPGRGVCEKLFSREDCFYWDFESSDAVGLNRIAELQARGLGVKEVDQEMKLESVQLLGRNPLQYAFFSMVEFIKIVFWETTRLGFVSYPEGLAALFGSSYFSDTIRLVMALLSLAALVGGWFWLFAREIIDRDKVALVVVLFFIVSWGFSLSFITILTRYALPLAPLFLLLIGISASRFGHNRG